MSLKAGNVNLAFFFFLKAISIRQFYISLKPSLKAKGKVFFAVYF